MRAFTFHIFLFLLSFAKLKGVEQPLVDNFHVCTVASHTTERLNTLIDSCQKHHIELTVLGLGLPYPGNATKLVRVAEYLETLEDDDIVMFIDAFDTLVVADKDVILEKFLRLNSPFIMSAEKICIMPKCRKDKFCDNPKMKSPFKFINSGSYIGYVRNLKAWLDDIQPLNPGTSDQRQITIHYFNKKKFFTIDHKCDLFLSLFAVKDNEVVIDPVAQVVRCLTTESEPSVLHANGGSFRLLDKAYNELYQRH